MYFNERGRNDFNECLSFRLVAGTADSRIDLPDLDARRSLPCVRGVRYESYDRESSCDYFVVISSLHLSVAFKEKFSVCLYIYNIIYLSWSYSRNDANRNLSEVYDRPWCTPPF